jgi:tripartite ATP-independent transporter DctM subunit
LVRFDREGGAEVALGIPVWMFDLLMPLGFAAIAARLAWHADERWTGRALAAIGPTLAIGLALHPAWSTSAPKPLGLVVVLIGVLAGAPLFTLLGGAAAWLFLNDGGALSSVALDVYRLATNPTLPAVPLFTLTGFLLAEGRAAQRLLALFRAAVGWLPGGTAVVSAALCAFFTTFTGGSGVTILVLGALLLQTLRADGYRDRFSLGLLTSAGSLGLLFPPAVPLIFYGVVARVPIPELFLGGILPGLLLVSAVAAFGVLEGRKHGIGGVPFSAVALARAAWGAKWEVALPALVLGLMLSGRATAVEAAAASVLFAAVIGLFVHRDVAFGRLSHVLIECTLIVGSVLIILGVALAMTTCLFEADVPGRLLTWSQANLSSRWSFLLALNLLLLAVGCLMDIFSAIAVVVPLTAPIGQAYGVDPVHLGIIFIANLELGLLTPLVGVNVFLASYRFQKPVLEILRSVLPFFAILAAGVVAITFLPWLTTAFLER